MGAFSRFGQRHLLAAMCFLCSMNIYMSRLNLSLAVVAMTKQNGTTENTTREASPDLEDDDTYDWTIGQVGVLLSSFYYLYIVMQVPGGWLALHFGFKYVVGSLIFVSSFFTLLSPAAADLGYYWLLAARVGIGACHGVVFPALHGAWTHWAPPAERSKLISIYVAGASVGTVIIFPLSGLLADAFGWRSIFYFTGAFSLLWCPLWLILVYDTPENHPWISKSEIDLIRSSQEHSADVSLPKVPPWGKILTSPAVLSLAYGHTASNWGNYQLNTLMPTYFANVLQFDVKSNGFYSALPYLLQSIICLFGGWYADVVRKRGWLRTVTVRKLNTFLGLVIPAASLLIAGYLGPSPGVALFFFVISAGFNAFAVSGCKISMLDFAPLYCGVIMGFSNTVANFTGILAPLTTGLLLDVDNTIAQWRLAFWISAIIYVSGWLGFQIFGTDQLQAWAIPDSGQGNKLHDNSDQAASSRPKDESDADKHRKYVVVQNS